MKRIPAPTVAAALAALLLQGCLSGGSADRLYGGLAELSADDPAAAAADPAAPAAGEAEARRREALAALAAEPDPPYRIGPGDRIEVRVQDHPDIGGQAVVGPDGSVGLLFLGQVSVAGLTIAEARDAIERGLEPFVRHPVAGVSALEVASRNATVAGAVARPGAVPVSNGTRLADVCALAGAAPDADLARSVLVRGGAAVPVDFRAAVERGDPLENVKVRPGDYVFLARREEAGVTICGEVRKPGVLPCAGGGRSLVGALAESGWTLETAWGSALVVREGPDGPRVWRVDVAGILAGEKRDVRVLPGDIVHVPPAEAGGAGLFGAPPARRPAVARRPFPSAD